MVVEKLIVYDALTMTRRPDPTWVSDDTLVTIAENINTVIPDAVARLIASRTSS